MKAIATVLLAALHCSAIADDVLVRTKTLEWVNGAPSQECSAEVDEYLDFEVEPGGTDVTFDCDLRGRHSETPNSADLEHSSDGVVSILPVTIDAQACTVSGASLAEVTESPYVYLRFTQPATEETWYHTGAVNNLVFQWLNHWLVDADGDGYSDPIRNTNGEIVSTTQLPPMRGKERNEIARCLAQHRNVKQQVVRNDYLISGPVNWPKLVEWSADCNTSSPTESSPPATLDAEQPTVLESCALFHSWINWRGQYTPADFSTGGQLEYLCNPSLEPGLGSLGYTGSQIAFWADRTVGEFSGFSCPTVEQTANGAKPADTRYDTSGLRAVHSSGPSLRQGAPMLTSP